MTTDKHNAPSVAREALNCPDNATPVARYDLSTSEAARRYIAEFFATEVRRHDFTNYIATRLAADFACALAQHLAATGKQQVGEVQGDARAALESAMPYLETLHSIVGGEARTSVWRCIERGRLALAARQPGAQEPVVVEAVATIKRDGDGELYVDWLTEGGIHDLPVGDVLLAANSAITNDEGYGEVYATPPAQGIDLGQLRALAEKFESYGDDEIGDAFSGPYYQCATELRGLIDDQRDAAPGAGQ